MARQLTIIAYWRSVLVSHRRSIPWALSKHWCMHHLLNHWFFSLGVPQDRVHQTSIIFIQSPSTTKYFLQVLEGSFVWLMSQVIHQGLNYNYMLLPFKNDIFSQVILKGQVIDLVHSSLNLIEISIFILSEVLPQVYCSQPKALLWILFFSVQFYLSKKYTVTIVQFFKQHMERIQEFKIDLPIFLDFSRKSNLASQTVQKIFMVTSTNSFHHMVSKVSISYKGITESRSSLPQHSFRSSNLSSHRHQVQIWFYHSMYNCFV